jgi:oligopeptidase A
MYCRRLHSSLLSTSCLLLLHTNTYNNTILTPQYSQSHALTLTHSDAQVHSLKNTSTSNNVSVSVSSNPLLQHHDLPKFAKISPTDVEPAVNTVLAVAKEEFTRVEESFRDDKVPSYASTIEALEILQFPLSFSWGVTNHLMAVKNSDDLRKARETVQPSVIEFSQRVGQSRRFFKALNELKNNRKEWNALDGTQRRVVNAYLRKMKNYGVGLSESERIRFNKLQVEVSELSTKFSNNVLDSTNSFKLKVTHVSDVEGLPMSARALATEKAKAAGSPEVNDFILYIYYTLFMCGRLNSNYYIMCFILIQATVESGPWVFTLDSPSYLPAMKHLKNRALRQQLYTAYVTRASSGDTDNSLVIRDILERKREMALMLVCYYIFFIYVDCYDCADLSHVASSHYCFTFTL